MDQTVDEVVSGRHDLKAAAVSYQKKMEIDLYARGERVKALEAQKSRDFAAAEKHWDNIITLGPDYEFFRISEYTMLLLHKKAPDEAAAFLSLDASKYPPLLLLTPPILIFCST